MPRSEEVIRAELEELEARCKELRFELGSRAADEFVERFNNLDVTCETLAKKELDRRHADNQGLAERTWQFIKGMPEKKAVEEIADSIRHASFHHRCHLVTTIIKIHEDHPEAKGPLSEVIGSYGSPSKWAIHLEDCEPCRMLRKVWELNESQS